MSCLDFADRMWPLLNRLLARPWDLPSWADRHDRLDRLLQVVSDPYPQALALEPDVLEAGVPQDVGDPTRMLEDLLRERAYARDCELEVERTAHGWLAAFKQYRDPSELAPR